MFSNVRTIGITIIVNRRHSQTLMIWNGKSKIILSAIVYIKCYKYHRLKWTNDVTGDVLVFFDRKWGDYFKRIYCPRNGVVDFVVVFIQWDNTTRCIICLLNWYKFIHWKCRIETTIFYGFVRVYRSYIICNSSHLSYAYAILSNDIRFQMYILVTAKWIIGQITNYFIYT